MISAREILPSNAGTFEKIVAETVLEALPIPFRDMLDPAKTPSRFLPFLAAHESVDLWFEDWSEERKRLMIEKAIELAALKGTRAAARRFLEFVDATIVHKLSYPARKPVGRIAAGITPIRHPNQTARFLLKTKLVAHRSAICVGRSAVGRAAVITIDRTPLIRAKHALVVSKSPETEYSVSFAHRVRTTLDNGLDLDARHVLGQFQDRSRL